MMRTSQMMTRGFIHSACKRSFHSYRHAVVREIDASLPDLALCVDDTRRARLDLSLARHQHENMVNAINSCNGIEEVFCLPSDGLADSVFIEDTAVIIDKKVLITRPGAQARQPETRRVKDSFRKFFGDIHIAEMSGAGSMDGGDVLYTGSEIIVGESSRTNRQGIYALQEAFPDIPVYFVHLDDLVKNASSASHHSEHALHLKSFCSVYGPDNQVVVGGALGEAFAQWLRDGRREDDDEHLAVLRRHALSLRKRDAPRFSDYHILQVPDQEAANCIYINGTLIRRCSKEFPHSAPLFQKEITTPQIELNCSELSKVDGAISCCSLLF